MKKILALVLTLMLVLGMTSAFAATITINRDSTWDNSPNATVEQKEATFTYYKIFDAANIDQDVVAATGEQSSTSQKKAVYTLSGTDAADKVAVLPAIFKVNNAAPSASVEAAADGKYYITLASESTTASQIAAALKTMVEANTTLFPAMSVTSDDNPVVIDGLDDAYYLIIASNGSVLAVQTLDNVTINEKNDYPKIDKKQSKTESNYADDLLAMGVGSYVYYEVTVHVPTNANKDIVVVDKMSSGLDYDETTGLSLSPNVAYSAVTAPTGTEGQPGYDPGDAGYDADADWQIKFTPTQYASYKGQDIVITFRAQVTEAALTDTGRENEVRLTYDNGNYVISDHVDYTTYFTGIEKVDGADDTIKLSGVKFTLTANGADFNVTKSGDYYIPGGTSNEVVTDSNGLIIIRGLDDTLADYVLTETETNAGYNLLEAPKTLTLVEDTTTAYATDNFDQVVNNQGALLPSTGGIGTTIFYVGGSILVLAAAILLITKRRMSNND